MIARLADDLSGRFGRGFGKANLANMRAFYLAWPAGEIFQTPSGKSGNTGTTAHTSAIIPDFQALAARFPLPWSAYVRLLAVRNAAARSFYETEALREGWSVRQLDRQISSQLYEGWRFHATRQPCSTRPVDPNPAT